MSLTLSPFVAALPLPHHLLFEYDEHGDAIMIDAATGERLMYGHSRRGSTGTLVASPIAEVPSPVAVCPPAPPRVRAPVARVEDDEGASPVRNLAEAMAEAVLEGEPREQAAAPPGGEPHAEDEWCVSVTVPDLALRLDIRHPRVLLNLLRFVSTYNEIAPYGEEIHLPLIPQERADDILSHVSIVNAVPEFAAEVRELRSLVNRYTEAEPEYDDDQDRYSTDSEDRRDYYRSYYRDY
jgi:hypothetical protein